MMRVPSTMIPRSAPSAKIAKGSLIHVRMRGPRSERILNGEAAGIVSSWAIRRLRRSMGRVLTARGDEPLRVWRVAMPFPAPRTVCLDLILSTFWRLSRLLLVRSHANGAEDPVLRVGLVSPCFQGSSPTQVVGQVFGGDAVEAAHPFLEPAVIGVDVV